jgi:hypothetical protein
MQHIPLTPMGHEFLWTVCTFACDCQYECFAHMEEYMESCLHMHSLTH